jgi:hypothetical protein
MTGALFVLTALPLIIIAASLAVYALSGRRGQKGRP